MHFNLLTISAALLPFAFADFKVYCGETCNTLDGAGCGASCVFMNNPASCSDVTNSVDHYITSDTTGCGGVACDGCDNVNPPATWTITRLEINDSQKCSPSHLYWGNAGDNPHFTIYNDNGVVNILDVNNNNVGTCVANAEPQAVNCFEGVGNLGLANQFDCTSDIYYLDSPN